jgi:chemotaxis protein methyltransferase CheR
MMAEAEDYGLASDAAFNQFVAWLKQRCGLDWTHYRPEYLKRRIGACMTALGIANYAQYLRRLEQDPGALERLRNDITINVTEFLRDILTYQAFKQVVIPEVATSKRKSGVGLVRAWSAGCATGEEPYSIGLCFLETLGSDLSGLWVCIHGTDVDEGALRHARTGIYSEDVVAPVPEELLEQFFTRRSDGTFAVGDRLRGMARFQRLDLIHDEPLKHVDIVFCRNVFIYLSHQLQERVLRGFHGSLNQGGFLVLGRTESMPPHLLTRHFAAVNLEERVYRKIGAEVSP